MIDYALTSLQPVAPVTVTHGGLLNASVTDGLGWLITLLALCAMPMLTRQGRDSLKALWAPVGSFLCRIGGAFLLGGLLTLTFIVAVLTPACWREGWDEGPGDWPKPDDEDHPADDGLVVPCLT